MRASLGLIKAVLAVTALAIGLPAAAPAVTAAGPAISPVKASEITTKSGTITATVQPRSATTTYELWLITEPPCAPNCETIDERLIAHGAIGAHKASKTLTVHVRALTAKKRYDVRLTATNENGEAEKGTSFKTP